MTENPPDAIVRYEVANGIARITLVRPPVNALSVPMIRAVVAAFQRAAADQTARAVVLSSAVSYLAASG
jgi:enoyl-CoA hydratase